MNKKTSKRSKFKIWFKASKFWQENYLILREFKNFRKVAIFSIVFSCLAALMEGLGIGLLMSFLQTLLPGSEPFKMGWGWFDELVLDINGSATSRLIRICILISLSAWMRGGCNYLTTVYSESAQFLLSDCLRKRIFDQLQAFPLGYFSQTRSGELINVITAEIEKIKTGFNAVAFVITRGLTVSVYAMCVVWISWQMTVISILLFGLIGIGLTTMNRRVRELSFDTTAASAKFTSIAIEFINGIRTIHAFATQDFERKRYYQASDNVVHTNQKIIKTYALVKPLADGVATTVLVSLIVLGYSQFVVPGIIQVSSLLTFLFILARLVPNIQDINGVLAFLSTLHGTVESIKNLLRTEDKTYFQNGSIPFKGLKHSIDFISVDFSYDSTNKILQNIKLSIERGKTTALVGGSGAGKTTLADLVPRFYDPTEGQIFIDGIDSRLLEIQSLRSKIAVVSQDTFIFNATVRENIAYGKPEATETEIREAAQLANALEFIESERMPQGLETQLGDRGVNLSGGQRQRIAIARALLRDPEILILDEATAALDTVSERLIQQSLEKISIGRTVITIAHRLSTIAKADKVVVMEKGRIVEQGNYQELLQKQGALWKYHKTQHETGSIS
ncbi:HlyB/MsbA family ABC transporter [Dulcicalothrix desertica PCC 7102]|uniref:HlyB/MsbA family ABC transporter n=1 Tax=Dulcicalothrix desertica PCC 7102 TaxID=232991 RepID=A0A3S1CRC7_9CYAN|nr:heterocyst formation ABC transporter subunit HepA [Dulcicalothrix desertica]RUT07880.1 HlyB/MsbA family ABC transporter [Dulcicalothrix desertica PCC 7102]TWH39401.1 ATP-binding cassette subfamily B protein [Dulcicalothrix desertica PCC 7102]